MSFVPAVWAIAQGDATTASAAGTRMRRTRASMSGDLLFLGGSDREGDRFRVREDDRVADLHLLEVARVLDLDRDALPLRALERDRLLRLVDRLDGGDGLHLTGDARRRLAGLARRPAAAHDDRVRVRL